MTDLTFAPFAVADLKGFTLQPAQTLEQALLDAGSYDGGLSPQFSAWSAFVDGRMVGCGGIEQKWAGRGLAWSLVGNVRRQDWIAITRRVRLELDAAHAAGMWRIEAMTLAHFAPGIRWLSLLGFRVECKMRAYDPWARDVFLFRRVDMRAVPLEISEIAA